MTTSGRRPAADRRAEPDRSRQQPSDASAERESAGTAAWLDKWAPRCPDGNPQELRRALGFRERNVGELELRVLLGRGDNGVCEVIVDEHEDEVFVRVLVCRHETRVDDRRLRDYSDWPVRVWLDRPLGSRAVIDIDSDEELDLFTPAYSNNVPRPDAGYRPANRRQRI